MPRFNDYDSDTERLPHGYLRVGYDADSQVYTFRDAQGRYYDGPAGVRYPSNFTRVSSPPSPPSPSHPMSLLAPEPRFAWRQELRPLLNFFLIIGLFLLGVFWLMRYSLGGGSPPPAPVCMGKESWTVKGGDTCWEIAREMGHSVEELLGENAGLDCDHLQVGRVLCLPPASSNV